MKKYIFLISAFMAFLTACSNQKKEGLEAKKEELAKLKTEQAATGEKIKALEKEIARLDPKKAAESRVKVVSVTTLNLETFKHYVDLQGSVDAKNNVMVTPKSGGAITAMYVKEGDPVRVGTPIGKIDDSILRESSEEVKTQLELARTVFEKQSNLWNQKIGTEIQYLQAKNNKEALERKLATLSTQTAQSNITSPISGVVDQVFVKVGELASPGMGVVRIVNLNNLKVVAKIADTYAASVKKGDEVLIKFPDLNMEVNARISFVGTTVDPLTRSFAMEANLPLLKGIKPNMMAQIQINDATRKEALVIDQNLVQSTEQGDIVYIVTKEGNTKKALAQKVKTGLSYNGKIEIIEGLKAGDELITLGFQEVSNGQLISY
jgi:membrane fusion protein (multidrug efflux system)